MTLRTAHSNTKIIRRLIHTIANANDDYAVHADTNMTAWDTPISMGLPMPMHIGTIPMFLPRIDVIIHLLLRQILPLTIDDAMLGQAIPHRFIAST